MICDVRLADDRFDPNSEFAAFSSKLTKEGAAVTFVGLARPKSATGDGINSLVLELHPRLTEASLHKIAADAQSRFGVTAICVVHRHGEISPGEAIVFVAAAHLHRRSAFEAAEYAMDRLKTDAVFWKKEETADGSKWIEPTRVDHADRARWS